MGHVKSIFKERNTNLKNPNYNYLNKTNINSPKAPDWMNIQYPILIDGKLRNECTHKISFKKLCKFMPKG